MTQNIAIVGAGISGLTLARKLSECFDVTVFEKSAQPGGRMATLLAPPFAFDYGAQCFTARGPAFQTFLSSCNPNSLIREWTGNVVNLQIGNPATRRLWLEPHLVACPGMNALCQQLAKGLDVKLQCQIAPLKEQNGLKWKLRKNNGDDLGNFDWVVSTAPPTVSMELFGQYGYILKKHKMYPCLTLMVGFKSTQNINWIAAKVQNNPINWISIDSSKPERNHNITCLVAHARNNWSEKHFDDDTQLIQSNMANQLNEITGLNCQNADYMHLHKWKHALVKSNNKSGHFFSKEMKLAATSDWSVTSRIEEVWWSASLLAENIKSNEQ